MALESISRENLEMITSACIGGGIYLFWFLLAFVTIILTISILYATVGYFNKYRMKKKVKIK